MSAMHIIPHVVTENRKKGKTTTRLRVLLRSGREVEGDVVHFDSYFLSLRHYSETPEKFITWDAIDMIEVLE